MGGWVSLGGLDDEQLMWKGKDFQRFYLSYLLHPPSAEACAPLLGKHAASNSGMEGDDRYMKIPTHQVATGLPAHTNQAIAALSAPVEETKALPAKVLELAESMGVGGGS